MATKQVVFVLGAHWNPGENYQEYPWMFFHFDPMKDVDPSPVTLVFFDYPNGKLKTWNRWVIKRGKKGPENPDSEVELLPKVKIRDYETNIVDPHTERPSVLAFYDWVKKQEKGSIVSMQVFSHGWMGGPIIWDTGELGPAGESIDDDDTLNRDPHDTDFRVRDFFGSNPLAGAEGDKFAKAFAPAPLIKLWGCVAPDGLRAPVQNFKASPKNEQDKSANKAHLKDYIDAIEQCFAFNMAKQLKLPIWAAPLGWGSDPSSRVPIGYKGRQAINMNVTYRKKFPPDLKKDQWWRVSWFFRHQDKGVTFYRDVLKARIDATDYVEYTQAWLDEAKKLAIASLEPSLITSPRELQQQLIDRIDQLGSRRT